MDEVRHSVDGGLSPAHAELDVGPSSASDTDPFASPKLKSKIVEEVVVEATIEEGHERDATNGSDGNNTTIDEVQPIHDELKIDWLWWILEVIPLTWSCQDASGNWKTTFG